MYYRQRWCGISADHAAGLVASPYHVLIAVSSRHRSRQAEEIASSHGECICIVQFAVLKVQLLGF